MQLTSLIVLWDRWVSRIKYQIKWVFTFLFLISFQINMSDLHIVSTNMTSLRKMIYILNYFKLFFILTYESLFLLL